MSLGFSQTMVQKALFIASGVHAEALHWLIDNQHHPNVETPWNMTQLQVGHARRGPASCALLQLCQTLNPPFRPGRTLLLFARSKLRCGTRAAISWRSSSRRVSSLARQRLCRLLSGTAERYYCAPFPLLTPQPLSHHCRRL